MPYTYEQKHIDAKGRSRGERKRIRWAWGRRRVAMMLRHDPRMSDTRVSRATGTGRNIVRKVRRALEEAKEIPKVYERMGGYGGGVPWVPWSPDLRPSVRELRWKAARMRIAMQLREDPEMSDQSVARATDTNRLTVASEREILEKKCEIPKITKRRGSDGRVRGRI